MYKIICLLFVCFAVGYAADDRSIHVTWGKMHKGLTNLITVKHCKNVTSITWNKDVSENENALRATYKFFYKSQNKTRSSRSANLCVSDEKGTFEEVIQTFFLKAISNSDSCPIKKGTKVSYSTPFNYTYTIDRSGGCGEFWAKMKLFKKNHKTDLFPILIHRFKGTVNGC